MASRLKPMMISLNNMATQEITTRWLKVEYRFKYWDSIERKHRFHTTFTIRIEHKELPPAEQMVKEVNNWLAFEHSRNLGKYSDYQLLRIIEIYKSYKEIGEPYYLIDFLRHD